MLPKAAESTDHIEGMHRLDGLDERVFKEAELVVILEIFVHKT